MTTRQSLQTSAQIAFLLGALSACNRRDDVDDKRLRACYGEFWQNAYLYCRELRHVAF